MYKVLIQYSFSNIKNKFLSFDFNYLLLFLIIYIIYLGLPRFTSENKYISDVKFHPEQEYVYSKSFKKFIEGSWL